MVNTQPPPRSLQFELRTLLLTVFVAAFLALLGAQIPSPFTVIIQGEWRNNGQYNPPQQARGWPLPVRVAFDDANSPPRTIWLGWNAAFNVGFYLLVTGGIFLVPVLWRNRRRFVLRPESLAVLFLWFCGSVYFVHFTTEQRLHIFGDEYYGVYGTAFTRLTGLPFPAHGTFQSSGKDVVTDIPFELGLSQFSWHVGSGTLWPLAYAANWLIYLAIIAPVIYGIERRAARRRRLADEYRALLVAARDKTIRFKKKDKYAQPSALR